MAGGGWRKYFEFSLTEKKIKAMDCTNYAIEFIKINVESLVTFSNIYVKRAHPDEYARTFNIRAELSSEGKHVT